MEPPSIGSCPICLTEIATADEAFLDTCLHHYCFPCIREWLRHQTGTAPACPLCKRPFQAVIYDCDQAAYRIWRPGSGTRQVTQPQGFGPTPEHRRRRAVYLATTQGDEGCESLGVITLSKIERPATAVWLQRELQALLLEEDVDLIAQHMLGTLSHAMGPSKRLKGDAAATVVAAAAEPYLPDHSARFGREFARFLASGLNVAAYDDLCRFGVFKSKGTQRAVELRPGIGLTSQTIALDVDVIRYRPVELVPSKSYEVRVSAPATIPASIHLWLEPRDGAGATPRRHRKLLNAEKVVFRTGTGGGVMFDGEERHDVDVLFQAKTWARSREGPENGPKFLIFDVVMEENVMGIPVSALPLVAAAVVLVALCVAIVPWWSRSAAPAAIEWIQNGGARRSQQRTRARGGAK